MNISFKSLDGTLVIKSGETYCLRKKDLILGKDDENDEVLTIENGNEVFICSMLAYQVVVQNVLTMERCVVLKEKMKLNIPSTVHVQDDNGVLVGFYSVQSEQKEKMNVERRKLKREMNEQSENLPPNKKRKIVHTMENYSKLSKMDIGTICHIEKEETSVPCNMEQKLGEILNNKLEEPFSMNTLSLESITYPSAWEETSEDFSYFTLDSNSEEYKSISNNFIESCPSDTEVTSIIRVQNKKLWFWYHLKRQEITSKKLNNGSPNEQFLFHGSAPENISKIVKDGFDHRLSKSTSSIGQGVYFARGAKTSLGYLGNNQSIEKSMLLCRVTVGSTTPGMPGLRRPPQNQETNELFDSVYGYIRTFNRDIDLMYAVFDNYQSYPEYIINFKQNNLTTPVAMPLYSGNPVPNPMVRCLTCHIRKNMNTNCMMHQMRPQYGMMHHQGQPYRYGYQMHSRPTF